MNQISLADRPLGECTIPAMLLRRAAEQPDDVLLRSGDIARTGVQQVAVVSRFAASLAGHGIVAGDRVALLAGNRVELLDAILACGWIGAVAVPLNTAVTPDQLLHALTNSGARLVIADRLGIDRLGALAGTAEVEMVWSFDDVAADAATGLVVLPLPITNGEIEPAAIRPGDTAAILYTSGTTGPAKGVVCPHAQFYWWGRNVSSHMELTSADVLYTTLPLFHTNALNAFVQALVSGAEFVVGAKFSASRFWAEAAACGATFTYLLGAMVGILMNRDESEFVSHTVRAALAPATPPAMLLEFRERFGISLIDGFGSTETNSVITVPLRELRPGFMGKINPGFEMRVVGFDGEILPAGSPGELLLRSDQPHSFAKGYFKMPAETVTSWDDLWFHTGDRVVVDEDGWVRFVDRIKDVIRRRGENISSTEVEHAIRQHGSIADVAAYGVASELGEEEVQVSVILKSGAGFDPAELIAFLIPRLAYFAVPRFVVVEDELPKTANGKVRKAALRDRDSVEGLWDRELAGITIGRTV